MTLLTRKAKGGQADLILDCRISRRGRETARLLRTHGDKSWAEIVRLAGEMNRGAPQKEGLF